AVSMLVTSRRGCLCRVFLFFFSSRRRHTSFSRDWSSDVCSSDLLATAEWIGAWGLTETGSGSDAGGLATTAIQEGDYFVINGSRSEERRVGKECRARGRPGR